MCSRSAERIAEIGRAIEDLANEVLASAVSAKAVSASAEPASAVSASAEPANAVSASTIPASTVSASTVSASTVPASPVPSSEGNGPETAGAPARAWDANQVAIRLAELWSQLAELDPEVARRLPTYEA